MEQPAPRALKCNQQKAVENSQRHASRPGDDEAYDLLLIRYLVEPVIRVSLVCRAIGRALLLSKEV
ncbi:protein of unknown function [Paraburkholderia dioscoreae]|uniref:Uncharacterized protein n=1 Tax=Paraburkholderia dioscoreae TaxID=2604047 RepID=A0A5Q4Z8K0_9BURK|nr:protein of unknown function [Paraburkholderia dioscoreae]